MANLKSFKLKSGADLQVQPAPFEKGVAVIEAVGQAILGKDPDLQLDKVALFDPRVRAAIFEVLPYCLYNTEQMSLQMFHDPKIGDQVSGDWFEVADKIIEVHRQHFFPKASSGSSTPEGADTAVQP